MINMANNKLTTLSGALLDAETDYIESLGNLEDVSDSVNDDLIISKGN